MDYLKDEQLEASGLIHPIDTLKIIQEANQIKIKKRRFKLKLLVGTMIISAILAQWILFEWFGIQKELMMMGGIYFVICGILLLVHLVSEGGRV